MKEVIYQDSTKQTDNRWNEIRKILTDPKNEITKKEKNRKWPKMLTLQ